MRPFAGSSVRPRRPSDPPTAPPRLSWEGRCAAGGSGCACPGGKRTEPLDGGARSARAADRPRRCPHAGPDFWALDGGQGSLESPPVVRDKGGSRLLKQLGVASFLARDRAV